VDALAVLAGKRVLYIFDSTSPILAGEHFRRSSLSRAADWTACRKGLLDKKLKKKTAQLLMAIQWRGEILAFGKHAIEALRDEMGAHSQLLGDQYGLSAFTNGGA
jgi:hypothetical protein